MQPIRTNRIELPAADRASAEHSGRVVEFIRAAIEANDDSISFAEFMQHALYAPGLGYYSAGATKFGEQGDFVTAPEISPLFGYVLARQAALILEQLDGGDVFEPGAGSGALAVSVLRKLDELQALPERYLILEVSADLQERQEARLRQEIPQHLDRVTWVTEIPVDFVGVVIANEVLDAIPVERFLMRDGAIYQARVGVADGVFVWRYLPAPTLLDDAVRALESSLGYALADGYESEVALGARHWVRALASSMSAGFVFLIDYGVATSDYYVPDRDTGWLRCHFRHHAHSDPLLHAGIQDITSWVDFTAVAEAASENGLSVAGYLTQADFLLHGGLEQELANFASLPVREQVTLSGQVKTLTLPGEMGESFKCMGITCGEVAVPPSFHAADRSYSL